MIPFNFLNRLWPLVFVGLGAYLVYRSTKAKEYRKGSGTEMAKVPTESKEEAQTNK